MIALVRGLYTAGTGMMVQRGKMDVVTNNIVNAETTGFKSDTYTASTFENVLMRRINDPEGGGAVGTYGFGTHTDEVYTDFTQGSLETTGGEADLAISGNGFFTVQTPDGEAYTRAGNFFVNSEGYLTNSEGCYVLGQNGRIRVGTGGFAVGPDGSVTAGGRQVDRLRIVDFENPATLRKIGGSLFTGGAPAEAQGYSIRQGSLEGSNVSITGEMVNMITLYRIYEANQKVLTMTDETLGMAVSQIGSLR